MSPRLDFHYDSNVFSPPAPSIDLELRCPTFPLSSTSEKVLALLDTGADGTVVPWSIIHRLNLQMVDRVEARGYDEVDSRLLPVFSVHLTITGLTPIVARVIPKELDDYAIVGRDILNEWSLKLDGPNRIGLIET